MTSSHSSDETSSDYSPSRTVQEDYEAQESPSQITPLPKGQFAALCLARLADPTNFSHIFPYINEFLIYIHVTDDVERIGFYSGFVESIFSLCQLLTIHQWSKLSDRIGRRPVIALGMMGIGIATMGFGLSRSLMSLVAFRALGGLCSGNGATIHVVLGEITDSTNQHIAFPLYGIFWPLGHIIGPSIGGLLAHPAESFGGMFDTRFFRHRPYFLPSFVCSIIALITAAVIWFFLKETNPCLKEDRSRLFQRASNQRDYGTIGRSASPSTIAEEDGLSSSKPRTDDEYDTSVRHLLSIRPIRALCYSGCALCLEGMAFDIAFVLFCFTPIESGGLGFERQVIGAALSFSGFVGILLQITIMPPLLRRYSASSLYLVVMALWPFIYMLIPISAIIRRGSEETYSPLLLAVLGFTLLVSKVGNLGYSLGFLLTKIHSPHPRALASANSLVLSFGLVSRSIAPLFVSSLFAFSVEQRLLGGYLWILIMIIISFGGYRISLGLKGVTTDNVQAPKLVDDRVSVASCSTQG